MDEMRNNFSRKTKRAAYLRSGGICECHLIPYVFPRPCRAPLASGNIFYEHIDPDAISGRDDLDNCAALTKTCWRYKTDRYDKPTIAKANRRLDRNIGALTSRRPMMGSKASGWKKTFNHGWVRR